MTICGIDVDGERQVTLGLAIVAPWHCKQYGMMTLQGLQLPSLSAIKFPTHFVQIVLVPDNFWQNIQLDWHALHTPASL